MTRIKQISIWIIALAGLMIATGVVQAQQYDFKYNGLYYKKTKIISVHPVLHYEVKVVPEKAVYPHYSAGNEPKGAVTIPKSFTQGHIHTVKEIGDDAFYGCKGIMSVTIPNSVKTIGDRAFYWCTGITSVTIPNSVKTIGEWAFDGCEGITSVTIPNSVTTIGEWAFNSCHALKSVNLPDGIQEIKVGTFRNCEALQSIDIPGSVKTIGDRAFYWCTGITSVTIPNSVTAIGEVAFAYCKGITSVSIPSSITTIEQRTFEGCSALKSITLPNSIQEIGNEVFYCCYALSEIDIPSSVTTIGKKILWECISLKTVTVHWDTPLAVPDNAFDGINTANVTLKVPAGKEDAYRAAAVWKDFKITDPAPDVTPPVPGDGGKLSVYITHKEFDPTWKAATDNVTPKEKLEYTLFWKKTSEGVWNQRNVAWNSVFHTVEADANTEYEVYVRVKDEAGNYADYNKKTFKTPSSPPPMPGDGGKLTISRITGNGFTISWEKAIAAETPQKNLIYKVYCKKGGSIGSLLFKPADLKATLTDKASYTITGLGGDITIINPDLDNGYDVNVKVIDEAGSSAWYNEENVKLAPATVAVTGVTVAPATLTLEVGQTGALTATVAPATATNKAVTWTSSAPAIATVDASGTVKGIATGTATITVKTADGGKTATCAVTVKAAAAPAVKVTGITLNYSSITVNGDLERVQLIATVAPATATDQSLTWTSSDASVASVDGAGLVTIRKKGKATVTAKANDGSGVSASCLFDVIRTVANETIDGLRIYAADGALRLALPAPETVHIYNVEGSLVRTLVLPAGDHVLPLPSGVYVVRVGERVAKVMVK